MFLTADYADIADGKNRTKTLFFLIRAIRVIGG